MVPEAVVPLVRSTLSRGSKTKNSVILGLPSNLTNLVGRVYKLIKLQVKVKIFLKDV